MTMYQAGDFPQCGCAGRVYGLHVCHAYPSHLWTAPYPQAWPGSEPSVFDLLRRIEALEAKLADGDPIKAGGTD